MWYDIQYNETIKFIKNYDKVILEKEYRNINIVKNLNLLSPTTLRCITGLKFNELVKTVRVDRQSKIK